MRIDNSVGREGVAVVMIKVEHTESFTDAIRVLFRDGLLDNGERYAAMSAKRIPALASALTLEMRADAGNDPSMILAPY